MLLKVILLSTHPAVKKDYIQFYNNNDNSCLDQSSWAFCLVAFSNQRGDTANKNALTDRRWFCGVQHMKRICMNEIK